MKSKHSQQPVTGLADSSDPTSSPLDLRVNPQALLGNVAEQAMTDGCGPNLFELSLPYDRAGYLLRTRVASLVCQMQKGCSARWKNLATRSGRLYFRLLMSERRTGESGSGSSETCPTPDVGEVTGGRTARGQSKPGRQSLKAAVDWMTPRSNEEKGSAYQYDQGDHFKPRLTLTGQVTSQQWATPTQRDFRSGKASEATMARNSRPLNEQVTSGAGQQDQDAANSTGKPQDWPTPRTMTGGPETGKRKKELGRVNSGSGDLQAEVLSREVAKEWQTAESGKGSLNPAWVLQLQGFPDGWLDLTDEQR